MQYTDKQLIERVESLPTFKGWKGIIDVWVRSKADTFDRFDDKVYTFDCRTGTPTFIMVCTGTTNAGAQGLKHFDSYSKLGCAVLKSDVIVYDSHGFGLHKGKYDAYVQRAGANPFPYFRDNDKDNKAEEVGREYNDVIGANCHKAGWYSTAIGGWSVACLVRNVERQFNDWMSFMRRAGKPRLSVGILKEF